MPISAAPWLLAGGPPPAGPYDADIIILTMGRLADTLEAIASALSQVGTRNYVALLDQGTDGAARETYRQIFAGRPRAGYYVSATNLGVGGGRNFLSNIGHGKIIVALDNDAVFASPFVVRDALRLFESSARRGALAFRIMDATGRNLDRRSWGFPKSLQSRAEGNFLTTTFVGAGHAILRAAWQEAGGYDESLFFTWEEYDFSLRAIALGWRIEYRGDLTIHHKLSPESRMRWQAGRTKLYVRNRLTIARLWGASWLSLLPRIAGYAVRGALNGGFFASLLGAAAAIRRDATRPTRPMPPAMRHYIAAHENAHRGPLITRLAPEIFSRLASDERQERGMG